MARIIPTTLAVLMLAASAAHADTLLLASIDADKPTVDSRPKPGMMLRNAVMRTELTRPIWPSRIN